MDWTKKVGRKKLDENRLDENWAHGLAHIRSPCFLTSFLLRCCDSKSYIDIIYLYMISYYIYMLYHIWYTWYIRLSTCSSILSCLYIISLSIVYDIYCDNTDSLLSRCNSNCEYGGTRETLDGVSESAFQFSFGISAKNTTIGFGWFFKKKKHISEKNIFKFFFSYCQKVCSMNGTVPLYRVFQKKANDSKWL